MAEHWVLKETVSSEKVRETFADLDAVFSLEGRQVTDGTKGDLVFVQIEGKGYYVKRYQKAGKHLRSLLGTPRVVSEWKNLEYFERWGVATASVIAFGMERDKCLFKRGAMIVEELPDTISLADLESNGDERLRDRKWVASASRELADYVRLLHGKRFIHGDLKWRNILVSNDETPKVYIIDCPAGKFWISPFLEYRIIRELAGLDKIAKTVLSRTQRLRFFLHYLGKDKLEEADKKRIRKIIDFQRKRGL